MSFYLNPSPSRSRLAALAGTVVAALAVLGLLSASAGASPPCTDSFTGASGGLWQTASNWTSALSPSVHLVPTSADVACWPANVTVVLSSGLQTADSVQGGALQITSPFDTEVSLTLASTTDHPTVTALSLDNDGRLIAPPSQSVMVTGDFEWGGCDPTCGTPVLDATIDQTGGGSFVIDGTATAFGPYWEGGGSITTASPVSITSSAFASDGAETLTTTSTITLGPDLQLTNLDPATTISAAGLEGQDGDYGVRPADLVLTGGITTVPDLGYLQAGSVTLTGGVIEDDGDIVNGTSPDLSSTIVDGGTLAGTGQLGNLTNVSGIVSPGVASGGAPGTLVVRGDYAQGGGATFAERLAGASGTGSLKVTGTATLGGDLSITDEQGFAPYSGDQLRFVSSLGALTGTFATLSGLSAGDYSATYAPTYAELIAGTSTTTTSTTTTTTNTTTTTTGPPRSSTETTAVPASGPPVDVSPPSITGTPTPGHTLTCATGTWTMTPTAYTYLWMIGGAPISGAIDRTVTVTIGDEAGTLACVVSAANASGTGPAATSAGVIVAEPGTLHCPRPTGRLSGRELGPFSLGITRARARHTLHRYQVTANDFDNFCLYAGWGIRVGYPSARLLRSFSAPARTPRSARIVLALTANPFYALDGVRPGAALSAVAARLRVGRRFHIGSNFWYLAPGASARGVLKVRGGIIQEVGIASLALTAGTRTDQRAFLSSFKAG